MVTSAGSVAAEYVYSAYGMVRVKTGTLVQPFQYGGGVTDAATGLIKFGSRYYDTTYGRFKTQVDPTLQEPHDYLYAKGDPINLRDPDGDLAFAAAAPVGLAFGPIGWVAVGVLVAASAYIWYAHRKNARPSPQQRHQAGEARAQRDQKGEKKQQAGRYLGNQTPKKQKK